MPDAILTVPEAAELLKVCDKTVYTWTHRADFPAMKIGNTTRIPRDLLMDWVNAQATRKSANKKSSPKMEKREEIKKCMAKAVNGKGAVDRKAIISEVFYGRIMIAAL